MFHVSCILYSWLRLSVPPGTSTRFDLGQKYCGVNNGTSALPPQTPPKKRVIGISFSKSFGRTNLIWTYAFSWVVVWVWAYSLLKLVMGSAFLLGRAWQRLGPSFFECVDLHCVGIMESTTRSLPV